MSKIGIQGAAASFHDQAASAFFPGDHQDLIYFNSFRKLAVALYNGTIDYAVMAIENSIAGTILPNLTLIQDYKLKIIAEHYLRIKLNLLAKSNSNIKDIRTISSHPMALLQCQKFLEKLDLVQIIEEKDTANAAKEVANSNDLSKAAIAGDLAADYYHLSILEENIQDSQLNFTRFLLLSAKFQETKVTDNKASLSFTLESKVGFLADVLALFKEHGLNLTKIQSIPIAGKPYEYRFMVDFLWNDMADFEKVLPKVLCKINSLELLGSYKHQLPELLTDIT